MRSREIFPFGPATCQLWMAHLVPTHCHENQFPSPSSPCRADHADGGFPQDSSVFAEEMNHPPPHFRARLRFHFREHGEDRWNYFNFPENGHRRVPMQISGVDSMYTLGMWRDGEARFDAGDETEVDCISICPEAIDSAVVPGAIFELWDCGFFAEGRVTERFDAAWPGQQSSE